jgi:hypothetical protein
MDQVDIIKSSLWPVPPVFFCVPFVIADKRYAFFKDLENALTG